MYDLGKIGLKGPNCGNRAEPESRRERDDAMVLYSYERNWCPINQTHTHGKK